MSMVQVTEGAAVEFILPVYLVDAAGAGVGGLAHTDVVARYKREGAASVAISAVAAGAEGTWVSGGWIAAAGLTAGNYELHIPSAAFLTGARYVVIEVGATGARTERYVIEVGPFEITLATDVNGVIDANMLTIEGTDATDALAAITGADPAAIADAVWDEARAGHVAAGTFGEGVASVQGNVAGTVADVVATVDANVLTIEGVDATDQIAANSSGGATAGAIADAVWDEARADHVAAGSFGEGVASVQGAVGSVTNRVTANADQIAGSATAATKLAASAEKLIVGNALTVSATQMTANISVDGDFVGATIVWDNGSRATVTSYSLNAGVGTFGYATLTSPPSGTPAFAIY